ncbi:hypothetical protein G6F57_020017 [Rhizopus arrhizus]|nr:hypothetical protein G6F57_020017 [Rhizopus arrhizus]
MTRKNSVRPSSIQGCCGAKKRTGALRHPFPFNTRIVSSAGAVRSEILLVADVRHGAVIVAFIARRERILAAADHVLGAHGELAGPGSTPGQPDSQAFPFAGLARNVDDTPDDAAGEIAVAGADAQALAVPAIDDGR